MPVNRSRGSRGDQLSGRATTLADFGVGMGAGMTGPGKPAWKGRYARRTPNVIDTPADQSIVTVNTQNELKADRNSKWTADGAEIGNGSTTLAWRPTTVDLDVTLAAEDAEVTVVVAAANLVPTTLNTWTANATTVATGQTDYNGGTNAYKVTANAGLAQHYITRTPSPAPSNGYTGGEVKFKAGTIDKVMVLANVPASNRKAIYDLGSGESALDKLYLYPMEDMGDGWTRFWFQIADNVSMTSLRIYLTDTFDFNTAASTTMAGTETVFEMEPYVLDGRLPFNENQKSGMYRNGSTAYGAERWSLHTEFNSSVTDMGVQNVMYLDVLLPTTYSTSNQYKVVYLMPVEGAPTVLNNELEEIQALNLHNTMDCIFVRPWFYQNRTWGGTKSDGTINHDSYISEMLPALIDRFYSTQANREGRTIVGYSAGGFAAMTQLNRRPDVWGYCLAWDVPLQAAYAAYDQAQHFGTQAQYEAYDPMTHFDPAGWSDRPRLVFGGGVTFISNTNAMFALLESTLGHPLNNDGTDYATAITDPHGRWWKLFKDNSGLGGVAHDFLSDWVTPGMAALQELWDY